MPPMPGASRRTRSARLPERAEQFQQRPVGVSLGVDGADANRRGGRIEWADGYAVAGIVTEVCVAFPALSALEEGYEVFVVTDASGTFNQVIREWHQRIGGYSVESHWVNWQRAGSLRPEKRLEGQGLLELCAPR